MNTTEQPTDIFIGVGYIPTLGPHKDHLAQVIKGGETPAGRSTVYYWIACSCSDVWMASRESIAKARVAKPYYWDTDNFNDVIRRLYLDGQISTRTYHAALQWNIWPEHLSFSDAPPRPLTVGGFRLLDDASILRYVINLGRIGLVYLRAAIGESREGA